MDTFINTTGRDNSTVETTPQTLWLAASVLALCAGALSAFCLTQRNHRGFRWWTGALWLNAASLGLMGGLPTSDVTVVLAQALAVPWPVLTLVGLRRFHSRLVLPGSERIDTVVLTVIMATAAVAAWVVSFAMPLRGAAAAVLLYASATLWRAPAGAHAAALRAIAALWLVLALLQALAFGWPSGEAAALQTAALCMASLAMTFVAISLSHQRTEDELRSSRRRLRLLANIDMLTQVPNRRRFEELARHALQTDEPGSAALLLLDIDHFKQINDRLGHAAGDRALRLVSRCALDLLRVHDVVGRHGGDEFVLLLRRSSTSDAMAVAERLVRHLQLQSHAHALPLLCLSFGIVQMRRGESIEDILLRADDALYEAKRLGRSRAVAADGDGEQPLFRSSQRLGLSSS